MERLKDGAELDRLVRCHIYQSFARDAHPPSVQDLATALDQPPTKVTEAIDRLAEAHAIALSPGTKNIWMAFPFSAVPTSYPVRTTEQTYWANCAWDAMGIPALLGVDARVQTQCADCGEPLTFGVRNGQIESGPAVVHFLVPPRQFWENVGFT